MSTFIQGIRLCGHRHQSAKRYLEAAQAKSHCVIRHYPQNCCDRCHTLSRYRGTCHEGSVTVYMALILCLMFSLLSAGIQSVRYAAARTQILHGVDIGLYSLFAQYDRTLLDRFDLFAIDASGADGSLDLGFLYDEFNSYMRPILHQNHQRLLLLQSGLSGYSLLTDDNGAVFYRQAVQYMRQTAAAQFIAQIQERNERVSSSLREAQEAGARVEDPGTMANYSEAMEDAARRSEEELERQREEAAAAGGDGMFTGDGGAIPDPSEDSGTVNPIPLIQRVMNMGILPLVFPPTKALSGEYISTGSLPSRRILAGGAGMEGVYPRESGIFSDPLFQEYVVSKLGHFMRPADQGLQYQLEYVLCRKDSDQENLESVARRLLLIREGVNAAAITADPMKMNQAISLSCVIAAGFHCSPAPAVILAALVVCWAFAESVLDVRTLLEGGKVPLIKTADQWQLSLENLPDLLSRLDSDRRSDPGGISYTDYLQGLLFMENRHFKIMGTLDMIEQTMQKSMGWEGFRIDHCVAGAGGSVDILANERWYLTAERTFCYD